VQAKSDGILLACISETLRYELEEAPNAEQASTSICKVFKTGELASFNDMLPN
jgi:hypothetical protein